MIDIENVVVSNIITATRTKYASTYPGLKVYSTTPRQPESFPCVVLEMVGNASVRQTYTFDDHQEHHADVTFQLDVFCNNGDDDKQTAKTIFDFIDRQMQDMGFMRIMAMPTPNIDRTIYRITGRYTGRPDAGITTTVNGTNVITFSVFR